MIWNYDFVIPCKLQEFWYAMILDYYEQNGRVGLYSFENLTINECFKDSKYIGRDTLFNYIRNNGITNISRRYVSSWINRMKSKNIIQ